MKYKNEKKEIEGQVKKVNFGLRKSGASASIGSDDMKDKNGEKIFTGDIVGFKIRNLSGVGVVCFGEYKIFTFKDSPGRHHYVAHGFHVKLLDYCGYKPGLKTRGQFQQAMSEELVFGGLERMGSIFE